MPGVDGVAVARKLSPYVPIILITGVQSSLVDNEAGLFACRLQKPVDPTELLAILAMIDLRNRKQQSPDAPSSPNASAAVEKDPAKPPESTII